MVEAKKNLNIHILNIICGSKYKSAGVNATPIKLIPPHIPRIDPNMDKTLFSKTSLTVDPSSMSKHISSAVSSADNCYVFFVVSRENYFVFVAELSIVF